MLFRRRISLLSVVVPAYDVEAYLPAALDSILGQSLERCDLEVVVVDDGSPDASGDIAESYAARDPRVQVVHTENRGLGAARNEGLKHIGGDLLMFADSDDVVPPGAYAALLKQQRRTGADLVTGSVHRWEPDGSLVEPPWMRRLHHDRQAVIIDQHPELLGDVFAWNKLFRAGFWREAELAWVEGTRYEDQPTVTDAMLRARLIGVVPDVVYHWRIRGDGSSITQQRGSLADLEDRWRTKQMALASVEAYGVAKVTDIFRDRVLAGDLHRYFQEIPGCSDEWWHVLSTGVLRLWGGRSLTRSGLLPVDRLVGWLVEQGRRAEAAAVVMYARELGRPVDRVDTPQGRRLDLPEHVIDVRTVRPEALAVRANEG
jgi:glycosyltransferase involved in cell wall biosynthesis